MRRVEGAALALEVDGDLDGGEKDREEERRRALDERDLEVPDEGVAPGDVDPPQRVEQLCVLLVEVVRHQGDDAPRREQREPEAGHHLHALQLDAADLGRASHPHLVEDRLAVTMRDEGLDLKFDRDVDVRSVDLPLPAERRAHPLLRLQHLPRHLDVGDVVEQPARPPEQMLHELAQLAAERLAARLLLEELAADLVAEERGAQRRLRPHPKRLRERERAAHNRPQHQVERRRERPVLGVVVESGDVPVVEGGAAG